MSDETYPAGTHTPHDESIALGAVPALTVRVAAPWTSSRTKLTREKRAKLNSPIGEALKAANAYMPRTVVPAGTGISRRARKTSPVVTTWRAPLISRMAPTNGGNPDD